MCEYVSECVCMNANMCACVCAVVSVHVSSLTDLEKNK